ncbi:MAG: zinc-ribbon and DUF3426 domain-containing protein [Pseudomonadales bacterium]
MSDIDSIITRCPSCETSFRITVEQMEMAAGAVRCGSCLRIFQADEQIIKQVLDELEPTDSHVATPPELEAVDDEPVISEQAVSSREEIISEFWSAWDEYVRYNLVPTFVTEESSLVADDNVFSTEPIESEEADLGESALDELVARISFDDDEDDYGKIVPDYMPEEVVGGSKDKSSTHNYLMAMFAAVLVLVGALQFAWFNKDRYVQHNNYRPWYELACAWLGCELPDYSDAHSLATIKVLVRPHPNQEDALIVDAIIRNSAIYRQQYPLLELKFQDIEDVVVASRRFKPREYLAGELRGLKYIPANTEVRLSLEILHPDEDALGYSLEVIANPISSNW